jgi:hypothetical protein
MAVSMVPDPAWLTEEKQQLQGIMENIVMDRQSGFGDTESVSRVCLMCGAPSSHVSALARVDYGEAHSKSQHALWPIGSHVSHSV